MEDEDPEFTEDDGFERDIGDGPSSESRSDHGSDDEMFRGRSRGRGGHGRGGRGRDDRGDDPRGEGRGGRGRERGRRPKHRGGRGRMGRGDVRSALLITLLDGSGHGYELIKNLEERTEGRWTPSPGSVYPHLQMLSDEGLVTSTETGGRRVYTLTEAGRAEAESIFESRGVPWKILEGRDGHGDLMKSGRELHLATKQVAMTGSPAVVAKANEVLVNARRALYQLLADA